MKNKNPFVSIIMATYNAEHLIERTLLSVKALTYSEYELIILDGASKDNTVHVVNEYNDIVDSFCSAPDRGIYDAWNKGLGLARGDWICFIGAGDEFLPDALTHYASYIESQSRLGCHDLQYISSKAFLRDQNGIECRVIGMPWSWPKFSKKMTCAHVGSFHHRRLFKEYGIFNSAFRVAGDYELLLRAKSSLRSGFINQCTVSILEGGVSNTVFLALREAKYAKRSAAVRSRTGCEIDRLIDLMKIMSRKILVLCGANRLNIKI